MKLIVSRAAETKKIAAKLAKKIIKSGPRKNHARVVALSGELGAGKTTFAQGFAKALGIRHRIVSPTFMIFRDYEISGKFKKYFHVDAYRIENQKELLALGFREAVSDPKNIFLIEWAEKIRSILPKDAIWVELSHGKRETERTIAYRR